MEERVEKLDHMMEKIIVMLLAVVDELGMDFELLVEVVNDEARLRELLAKLERVLQSRKEKVRGG
jgi:hypothetical protein